MKGSTMMRTWGITAGLLLGLAACDTTTELESSALETAAARQGRNAATVQIVPASDTLTAIGATLQLEAVVRDERGKRLPKAQVTWSSSNRAVGEVDQMGIFRAVTAGSAVVIASVVGCAPDSALVVVDPQVASVVLADDSVQMTIGATRTFEVTVRDANQNVLDEPVAWATSNAGIASVTQAGVVTAVSAGTALIRAAAGGRADTATVTVSGGSEPPPPPPPPSGTVDTVFSETFESGSLSAWQDGVDPNKHRVVTGVSRFGQRSLEVTYPQGADGGWLSRFFMPGYDSIYVSMWILFEPEFVGETKMLLLRGSRTDNQWSSFGRAGDCPNGTDFFLTNIVFTGAIEQGAPTAFYTYWPNMRREPDGVTCWGRYGDGNEHYYAPRSLTRGQWHQVEFWVKLNTPGQANAFQRYWLDGHLAGEWGGFSFRDSNILMLNVVQLQLSMPPGAARTQRLWIDDVLVARALPDNRR